MATRQIPDYIANDPCMTTVFILRQYEWQAMWRGQVAAAHFNSKGAAQAWIDICEQTGKYRS